MAAAIEMVKANNLIILDKEGGMIKQMNDKTREELRTWIKAQPGSLVPIELKGNQFTVSLHLDDEDDEEQEWTEDEGGFRIPKRRPATNQSN